MTTASTSTNVVMPRLSDSMEEGVIVSWLVADGAHVQLGQEIVEVETDKATMPYEAEAAGTIHLRAAEGDTVAVGAVIALIGDVDELPAEQSSVADGSAASGNGVAARVIASPVARRMAAELGLDLHALSGTGPGGRIVKADVRGAQAGAEEAIPAAAAVVSTYQSSPSSTPDGKGETTSRELTRLQQVIARRMALSKATAPDFVIQSTVDMEAAVGGRAQLRELIGTDAPLPSYNDFVIKACALALREHPLANGTYEDGRIELHSRVNVGVAVAVPGALLVPTIFDADQKSLGEIARASRRLVEQVRAGRITPPELSGGTFSISNLGMFGVDEFAAVINPPQAAILAIGSLKQRAVAHEGELAVRHTMTISLTCDHRILYGADAAEFLARIKQLLEAPGALVL